MNKLKVLQAYCFSNDLESVECEDKLALTELEVIKNNYFDTYGYYPHGLINVNVYQSLDNILGYCPNLCNIHFQPNAFYMNITQLYKLVTKYSKQFKLIVISIIEDSKRDSIQKVNFDCSFLKLKANKSISVDLENYFPNCTISILE